MCNGFTEKTHTHGILSKSNARCLTAIAVLELTSNPLWLVRVEATEPSPPCVQDLWPVVEGRME